MSAHAWLLSLTFLPPEWHVDKEDHWYLPLPSGEPTHCIVSRGVTFPSSLVPLPPLTLDAKEEVGRFFKSILTFIILYNNLIPISLIVTLEVRGQPHLLGASPCGIDSD